MLLVAALTMPAYSAEVELTYKSGGDTYKTEVVTKYTMITAGMSMWEQGGYTKAIALIYIIFVTTLPGMFMVSAIVAWVTSPLERRSDDDTDVALACCNLCGRLVSFDMWLYSFLITWMRLDDLSAAMSKNNDFDIKVQLVEHGAVYCGAAWLICLWMMHTLVEYAHSAPSQETTSSSMAKEQAVVEPIFAPPAGVDTPLLSTTHREAFDMQGNHGTTPNL